MHMANRSPSVSPQYSRPDQDFLGGLPGRRTGHRAFSLNFMAGSRDFYHLTIIER